MITIKKGPGSTDLKNGKKLRGKGGRSDNHEVGTVMFIYQTIVRSPEGLIHKVTHNKVGNTLVTSNVITIEGEGMW